MIIHQAIRMTSPLIPVQALCQILKKMVPVFLVSEKCPAMTQPLEVIW